MIIVGDSREALRALPDESIDACVTDPPYGLEFMGEEWDRLGAHVNGRRTGETPYRRANVNGFGRDGGAMQQWHQEWAAEVLRVLKPGAHLLAFGGTRTYHRLVCAVEDAGFEVRDTVVWLHGQGFPKSHNLDDEREGWGTALKPAMEPIVVARKPLVGTVAENVEEHGTGALNIDGCRIVAEKLVGWGGGAAGGATWNGENCWLSKVGEARPRTGRWPANVCHDGSEEVLELMPEVHGAGHARLGSAHPRPVKYSGAVPIAPNRNTGQSHRFGDEGSVSRFFYCAKATTAERQAHNRHPTVKPIALMRWLVRLVTASGGLVLDPFLGSGTTAIACEHEGFRWIGVELNPAYAAMARRRIREDEGAADRAKLEGRAPAETLKTIEGPLFS